MRKSFVASGSFIRATRAAALAVLVAGVVAAGCSTGHDPGKEAAARSTRSALIGDDGAITINAPNVQLNTYAVLAANVAAGATSLTVTNAADLTSAAFGALAAGDLVLVAQMQGATIDATDTAAFGAVTALNGAGSYELVNVASVTGNTIALDTSCGGLKNAYSAAAHTQVVRVPQPTSLTINAGASLVAQAWDGQRGGIVAVQVRDATTVNGSIDASGDGFRGGSIAGDNLSANQANNITLFRSADPLNGAEKGEGIAGYQASYDALGGRYGRGAPANGGGGGNSHNGGGGGGANAGAIASWTGQGVMSGADIGAAAWKLDPGYIANGNALTTSTGGGRGGYTFGNTVQDPLTDPPGDATWQGNNRREHGGLGGRPLDTGVLHLFLGGGGGAGDGNNGAAGPGGPGGGAILLLSGSVTGAGTIRAAGGNGVTSPANPQGDAPGGAGGGGTILIQSGSVTGALAINASGGTGGDQTRPTATTTETEGPGGGGGGGFIALSSGAVTRVAAGGAHGVTHALPLETTFPANGATFGGAGNAAATFVGGAVPMCTGANLGVTISDGVTTVTQGQTVTYTVTVTNGGPNPANGASIAEAAGAALTNITWTCAASAGSACGAASGTGALATTANVAASGTVTYTVQGTISPTATGSIANTVTVTAPAGFTDPAAGNNSATDTDTINAAASDVAVTLTPSTTTVAAGGPLDYTVGVANGGPGQATGVTVVQTLPPGATFIGSTGTGWTCVAAGVTVTCSLTGSIASGGSAPLVIHTDAPTTPGTASSSVTAATTSPDPSGGNNTATASVTVLGLDGGGGDGGSDGGGGGADLVITGAVAPDPVAPGGTLTYTIGVHNNGPSASGVVTVVNTLPTGATYTGSSGTGWTCVDVLLVVTCTHAGVPADGDAPLQITATAPATPGSLSDVVTVTSTTGDPSPGNNTITITSTDGIPNDGGAGDGGNGDGDAGDGGNGDGGAGDGGKADGGNGDAGKGDGGGNDSGVGCSSDSDCGGPTSGRVCEDNVHTCVPGCRNQGGNGCPSGQTCSSTGHEVGTCSAPSNDGGELDASGDASDGDGGNGNGAADDGSIQGAGFSCSASPAKSGASSWASLAGLALVVSLRRRRARRGGPKAPRATATSTGSGEMV